MDHVNIILNIVNRLLLLNSFKWAHLQLKYDLDCYPWKRQIQVQLSLLTELNSNIVISHQKTPENEQRTSLSVQRKKSDIWRIAKQYKILLCAD